MKYAVHFSYVGTAESTSVASVARRSWPESRSSGAARQSGHLSSRALSGSAEFSRTIGNSNATLLPGLVGLSLGSLTTFVSALGLAALFGLPEVMRVSI